jgi:hypothetical protein
MKQSNSSGVIIGVLLVIVVIFGIVSYQKNHNASNGSLYVGVTDASADIKNVSDINMNVKKVEIHNKATGWMTVSSETKKYSLLTLKSSGKTEMYAKNDSIESGTYDKVRVTLGDTDIMTKNNGSIKATMPSSTIVMNENIKVAKGENTHLKFDFLADKSLHTTSDGKYVFAPVVAAESRSNATVDLAADNTLNVSGGNVDSSINVGMDLDGSSKADFQVNGTGSLQIGSVKGTMTTFMLGGKSFTSDSSKVEEDENGGASVNGADTSASGSTNGSVNGSNSGSAGYNGSANGSVNGSLNGSTSGSVNSLIH